MNLDGHKKRLTTMFAIDGVCVIVALAALFGDFQYGIKWLSAVFVVALVVCFAAQVWFVMGFAKGANNEPH